MKDFSLDFERPQLQKLLWRTPHSSYLRAVSKLPKIAHTDKKNKY